MTYEYVKRVYGFTAIVGQRVQHTVTGKHGAIAREDKGQQHYVQVKFDGSKFALPCHPGELVVHP